MVLKKYLISATAMTVLAGSMSSQPLAQNNIKEEPAIERTTNQSGVSISVSDKTIKKGTKFNPKEGVTAKDYNGKSITNHVIVTHNNVDTNQVGIYKVGYAVLGSNGKRVDVEITVKVVSSENETFKTIIDASDISINKGNAFNPLKGVKAIDVTGLDITKHLLVTKNDVKVDNPGVYDVTYLVLDTQGNRVYKTIKVTVVEESNSPESGKKTEILANDITLNTGDVFKEKDGVKAIDVTGLDITMHILVTKNNVNTNRAGDYEVTYLVLDTQGNRIYKTIKVKVVGDPIITDKEQAQTVKEMIEALKDESSIELSDEDKVIEAREAYDKLSEEAKALVTNIDKLEKIESKLKIEKDKIIAKELEARIASLKDESLIELEDEAVLVEIREAYNNLSPEARILVTSIEKLETAETKLAELKKIENDKRTAKEVEDKITSLDRELEYADKVMIDAVRKEYEALSDEAKLLVPNLDVLERVEKEIETIFNNVTNVFNLIVALPEKIELTHKAQVEEARQAYEDLSVNEKKAVTKEMLSILEDSEFKIKVLEIIRDNPDVKDVVDGIEGLPSLDSITITNKDEVLALYKKYEELDEGVKFAVNSTVLIKAVDKVEGFMVQEVISEIEALPSVEELRESDESKLIQVRAYYEEISIRNNQKVTNLEKLELLEAKMLELKGSVSTGTVSEVEEKINNLPEVIDVQYSHEADIKEARRVYELLSPSDKLLVSNITKLEEVEAEWNRIKEGIELVTSAIHQIPSVDELGLEHEQLVTEARNAYDSADEKITHYVNSLNYQDLLDAEAKIKNLKDLEANPDAKALVEKIEMLLNKQLTEADRADVEGLRPAYELLSEEGKKLIIFGLIEELEMRLAGI